MNHNLLDNITTVEISTIIVDEIVDDIFIPWEVYQAIYLVSRDYLEQSSINFSLGDRYLQLRRQLELAYCLLLIDPSSSLYDRTQVAKIKRDLPILSQNNSPNNNQWETIPTRLPPPISPGSRQNMSTVNKLLSDRSFTGVLHQLNKRKAALDRRDRILRGAAHRHNLIDTTYAQTSLQLDGKIVNRYSQAVMEHRDRHLLLQLHEQSTSAGEQQWRGLIKFMLNLVNR